MAEHESQLNPEFPETEHPGLLDVVQLDGRWAQVRGGGGLVSYLDTNEVVPINWSQFEMTEPIHRDVNNLDTTPFSMSEKERGHLHFAAGENTLKNIGTITVFGAYRSKEK
ncbi:MAG TPA: hypothetical protein VMC43_01020 [Candidatus Paceibacterota bacterium]|nr:hypothetical protein [Candidatus Paceibacterota bacterium]